jgi:hypothetical protein
MPILCGVTCLDISCHNNETDENNPIHDEYYGYLMLFENSLLTLKQFNFFQHTGGIPSLKVLCGKEGQQF